MLKFDDDGGSFDRILREADKAANGDESLKLSLLTRRIVTDFVDKQMQASAAASLFVMREEEEEGFSMQSRVANIDNLGFCIPKKRRGTVTRKLPVRPDAKPPLPPQGQVPKKKKVSQKRCLDQTQDSAKEEEEVIRKPKKQRKNMGSSDQQEHVPEMPELFKNRIQEENGTDVVLVMQKHITASDLNKGLNRLSIPVNKIRADDFINEGEKILASTEGVKVLLIPPSLKENVTVDLKRWAMNNTFTYNLKEKWYSGVVKDADNRLEIGSIVQLWRFRKNITGLCFALVKVE